MKQSNFILTICLLMMTGCSKGQNNWNEITPKGITGKNISFNYLFINGARGVFLATNATDEDVINKRFDKNKGIVYTSSDHCRNWTRQQIGNGSFTSAAANGNFMCTALNLNRYGNLESSNRDSTSIYFSTDFGTSWAKISSFSRLYVRDIFCLSQNEIYLIAQRTGSAIWALLHTIDRGRNWRIVQSFTGEVISPVFINNNIFYLRENNITRYSLREKSSSSIKLENGNFDPYILNVKDNALYVSGVDRRSKSVQVEEFNPSRLNQFKEVVEIKKEAFPLNFHVTASNGFILLLGERSPLGVTYSVYYKKRDGRRIVIEVPSATFEPTAFNDNCLYGYSYSGVIYYLESD